MKRIFSLFFCVLLILCSCGVVGNDAAKPIHSQKDKGLIGKWIDTTTEQIIEYTDDGYYCEYINQSLGNDRTKYITENGKIYYYLDGSEPDMNNGIDYEIKNGHLFVAGVLEYRPMDIKTE